MAQTVQILRTTTNTPPPTLLPGALSVELGTQTKLWVGAQAGNRLLLSTDPTDITLSGGAIIASAAPNAMPGSLWWDSNIGQLYIRYFDGNSTAWVSASTGTSIALPLAITAGGTSAITAPAALTNLGAVAKAGDTMSGALTVTASVSGNGFFPIGSGGGGQVYDAGGGDLGFRAGLLAGPFSYAVLKASGQLQTLNAGASFAGAATVAGDVQPLVKVTRSSSTRRTALIEFAANNGSNWTMGADIAGDNVQSFGVYDLQAGAFRINIDTAGACFNTTGTWASLSDATLKQDIEPYTRGLAAIQALEPVQFRYRAGTPFASDDEPSPLRFGLVADAVREVIPEIVGETLGKVRGEDQTLATLNNGDLIFSLINAVKELNAKIEALAPAPPAARR